MYPNLYYVFQDLFDVSIPGLRIINTFGFLVAIAFLIAAVFLVKELKRKQAEGIFTYKETIITVGNPASVADLFTNFLLGFLLGYKLIGIFFVPNGLDDPQSFIFSSAGHLPAGILAGLFFAGLKWWEKNKRKLPKPEQRKIRIWPSDRVGDIVIIAAVSGFIGAKIFDNLENWDRFIEDPIGNLFAPSGLTFYGGLIVATLTLWIFFRQKGISFINVADAAAPSLMLAYGLGRLGCQVAGDGDWGILNSAFISNTAGKAVEATSEQFQSQMVAYSDYFVQQFGSVNAVQHAAAKPILGLPNWLFAYTYPHNVNEVGVKLANCDWDSFCNYLPLPVFPTPLYESIACILLFTLLWSIRKKFPTPGKLFGIYLILNGIERFFIEKIRVNTTYDIYGFHPTQAEIISVCMVLFGLFLFFISSKIMPAKDRQTE